VLTPARTWAGVRPWCLDTELFDDDVGFPDEAIAEDLRPLREPEPRAAMTALEAALDEPLGEALPEVTATDPFVTDLWQDLERGWDAELCAGPRADDELSPAPVSELRLFQAPPREAAWNRLEVLELDLSPLPPKLRDWSVFVTQISAYLIDHGATRASVVVSSLLAGERVNLRSLRSAVRGELCAAGVAEQGAHDCYPTETFRREASAFHELIVRRESAGSGALDWLGRLVFALLGGDVSESEVRSALEDLGVNSDASRFEQDAPPVAMPARAVSA
jgi:hypothetical protein